MAKKRQFKSLETFEAQRSGLRDFEGRKHHWVHSTAVNRMNVIEFAREVLGVSFAKRPAQELVLRLMYGLPLPSGTVEVYVEVSSVSSLVLEPKRMTWLELYRLVTGNREIFEAEGEKMDCQLVVGRRGGKSHTTAIVTLYEASRKKYRKVLNSGEIGYAVLTATRRKQAEDILLATCVRLLQGSKIASWMNGEATQSQLKLRNDMCIAAYPCSSKAALGLPMFFLAFDELAHFMVEGSKADRAVVDALRPGMQQFAACQPKMFAISTPAAKQGWFWEQYKLGFQQPGRLLIQAPSWVFNPPSAYGDPDYTFLKNEFRRDPEAFDREYRANFAERMQALLSADLVQRACGYPNRRPYNARWFYFLGIDQSAVSGADRFSVAIAHREPETELVVIDFVQGWDSKDPDWIMAQIRDLARQYRLRLAWIDRYATGWVKSALSKIPLEVELRPTLPEIFSNLKSLLLANRLEMPEHPGLIRGLVETQAFYSRANTMSISHERHSEGHGDEADAVATAAMMASQAIWLPQRRSVEEEMMMAAAAVNEENYNPLTWGIE